jgi:hypothetical protein
MMKTESKNEFGIENLMTLHDVRNVLHMSAGRVLTLVREGKLEAFNTGEYETVDEDTPGLRFTPSAVKAYLDSVRVN